MIAVSQAGRRGNAYFQFATALAYGQRHKTQVLLPRYSPYFIEGPGYDNNEELKDFFYYKEPSHAFAEIPFHENIFIDGYFQTSKYFDEYKEDILSLFGFANHVNLNTCAVHIRRGDYLLYPDHHPFIGEEYIRYAVYLMYTMTGTKEFHIYSDDIAWCKSYFSDNQTYQKLHIQYSEGKNDQEDLWSMAQCEHFIISNSSYSWWGAYAGVSKNKRVIAPKTWFGHKNSHLSTEDLYEKDWIKL